ncbi:hypothetical protein [Carnobacterium divergens]|uniref:hypothetical protein n=1 Tax=Carnobacterium divergens TaxID=2748 RepID=UPI001071A056|nr:hypothetical protein [Carnobacterium divergens]
MVELKDIIVRLIDKIRYHDAYIVKTRSFERMPLHESMKTNLQTINMRIEMNDGTVFNMLQKVHSADGYLNNVMENGYIISRDKQMVIPVSSVKLLQWNIVSEE